MANIEFRRNTKEWNRIDVQHYKQNIDKMFVVRDCRWEPGNKFVGKTGKCIDAYISYDNSSVRFIELDTCPGVVFMLDDLKEI